MDDSALRVSRTAGRRTRQCLLARVVASHCPHGDFNAARPNRSGAVLIASAIALLLSGSQPKLKMSVSAPVASFHSTRAPSMSCQKVSQGGFFDQSEFAFRTVRAKGLTKAYKTLWRNLLKAPFHSPMAVVARPISMFNPNAPVRQSGNRYGVTAAAERSGLVLKGDKLVAWFQRRGRWSRNFYARREGRGPQRHQSKWKYLFDHIMQTARPAWCPQ